MNKSERNESISPEILNVFTANDEIIYMRIKQLDFKQTTKFPFREIFLWIYQLVYSGMSSNFRHTPI